LLALQAKPRLPAAIADKSRDELQVYVVELLKKLKLRVKKIEGASNAIAFLIAMWPHVPCCCEAPLTCC
jgi:hypothetical protein